VEFDDRRFLFVGDPVVAGDLRVVLVDLAVTLLPLEQLGAMNAEPGDEPLGDDLGLLAPLGDEVDDLVSNVVGNPATRQGSPSSFFNVV
jgi:hypothetical protein